MWKNWQADKNYTHLGKSTKYPYGNGVIPAGVRVRFPDGGEGTVVHSSTVRTLISRSNSKRTGNTDDRAWYENRILEIDEK